MSRGRREGSYERDLPTKYRYPRKKTPFQKTNLKIGQLSKKTDVPVVTLRFYQDHKLIKPLKNIEKKTNHRKFAHSAIAEVEFIKLCRTAGFALPEIRSLMKLFRGFKPPARLLMNAVYRTLEAIRHRTRSLEEVERILLIRMRDPAGEIEVLITEDEEISRLRGLKMKTE
jgi:DNA-binding transcriptional MerR regulator